jgi:hypothetical protein
LIKEKTWWALLLNTERTWWALVLNKERTWWAPSVGQRKDVVGYGDDYSSAPTHEGEGEGGAGKT